MSAAWSVYVLRRRDGALYTGIATDVARRVGEHAGGRGAKSLRGRGPLQLVLAREVGDRGRALRVERAIQRLAKPAKEELLGSPALLDALIERAAPTSPANASAGREGPAG